MGLIIHLPKTVMINQQCHDLPDEEDPFDGPSKHKGVYKAGSGSRVNQCYDKPDSHAAHSSKYHGKKEEEPGMLSYIFKQCRILC